MEFFIVQVVSLISLLKSRGYSAGFLLKANQGLLHNSGVLFGISTFGIFQNEHLNGFRFQSEELFNAYSIPKRLSTEGFPGISLFFLLLGFFFVFPSISVPLVFPWSSLSFLHSFKLASMINLLAFLGCHFFLLTCFLEEIPLPF